LIGSENRLKSMVLSFKIDKHSCNEWNQCQSPLMLWVRISIRARYTTLCYKVCQWFSPGPQVSSTNKTDHHDIIEILLKVALNTIKQTNNGHCQLGVDHHSLLLDRSSGWIWSDLKTQQLFLIKIFFFKRTWYQQFFLHCIFFSDNKKFM
jgi:hypothetical protein